MEGKQENIKIRAANRQNVRKRYRGTETMRSREKRRKTGNRQKGRNTRRRTKKDKKDTKENVEETSR